MLTSLFGELGPIPNRDDNDGDGSERPDSGFAATAILESVATEVNARGQMVDRHSHDLVVVGSPAQAIRDHFASTRSDLDTASSLLTILDPANAWASAVIKALSDAGGRPIERLHLREHLTLRTLATIERTTLVRRHDDTLRIVHADVRAPGSENAEIPVALMERSQMTTVIIGPLQPHAIDALLAALQNAAMLPTWRCPNLLFMLPPNAVWIANKISAIPWPGRLHVNVLSESMAGASAVWNAMLGIWNHLRAQPGWNVVPEGSENSMAPPLLGLEDFPIKVRDLGHFTRRSAEPTPSLMPPRRNELDPDHTRKALAAMLRIDGLLGCAVVDAATGLPLGHEAPGDPSLDMNLTGAACAQVLRAHRQAARAMGMSGPVDEIISGVGTRQQVIRTLSRMPDLFLVMLLDRQRANLALARYQLMELERGLG